MKFLFNYIKGILIGAGAIIPGISSGVLCVIFGIYETLLNSILNFFKDWKTNIKFLTPFILGGLTGIIIFSNIILFLFERYPEITSFTFIGLILGCIPSIFKICNSKEKFKLRYILFFIVSFIIAILLLLLENKMSSNVGIYYGDNYSFEFLILAGFLMSIGVVVPGVSSTVILMLLGVYETYLYAVSIMNMRILLPMGIGLLIGGFLCMKLIQFLLNKYHSQTTPETLTAHFHILQINLQTILMTVQKYNMLQIIFQKSSRHCDYKYILQTYKIPFQVCLAILHSNTSDPLKKLMSHQTKHSFRTYSSLQYSSLSVR